MRAPLIATALSPTLLGGQPVDSGTDTVADPCGASAHIYLFGPDAWATKSVTAPGQMRVLRPGEAVTLEFRRDR